MKRNYKHYRTMLFLLLALLMSAGAFAQRKVTGKVTSITDGLGLPGVSVVVNGTTNGTTTDTDGKYSLDVPANATILRFSFIGFETQTLPINADGIMNVTLKPASTTLDAVVVTGYGGTVKRSKLTNSISTVKDDILKVGIYSNPAQALSGAVSGLKVVQTSGNPGATPVITLRGGTNLDGSGSPLYMVDGQVRSGLNDMNPEDIESIEVLKDAGATAIYGARANNGVVLVTTKRGKEGKTDFNFKSRVGLNYINNPYTFLRAADYLKWARTGINNAANMFQLSDGSWFGPTTTASLSQSQPYGTGNAYFAADGVTPLDGNKVSTAIWSPMLLTDNVGFLLEKGWQKMTDPITGKDIIYKEFNRASTAFNNPAITQDYNISLTGGNDKGGYYAGFGYNYAQEIPAKTFYQRINFTFNGDYKLRKWITSSSSIQYADARWKDVQNTGEGNYFARMISAPPTMRERNPNGDLILGSNLGDGNPLATIDKFIRKNNSDKFTLAQSFKFDIMKGLNVKFNGNLMYDESFVEAFNKDYQQGVNNFNTTRATSAQFDRTVRQTYNTVANYDVTVANDHNINALAGVEYYDSYNYGVYASGTGAPTDDFADLGLTAISTTNLTRSVDSWHIRERIESAFGRLNYDYKTKYIASFTFRQDGYSKLLNGNRWGFFPGASAGWVISKEDFMKKYEDILSFWKLRASYGENGNVSGIGAYTLQGSYGSNLYNANAGYSIGSIANPTLKWEHSQTFEIGTDLGFLKNKINANFTWYNRLTADKYASIPLPESSGISGVTSNNGSFRNRGIELDLSVKVLRAKDFTWDITANVAHNVNTVVKLPNNALLRNRQGAFQVYGNNKDTLWVGGYQEGQTPGAMYGFLAEGIYKDADQVAKIAANRIDKSSGNNGSNNKIIYGPAVWATLTDAQKKNALPIQPGDVIWKDVNGDGVIDDKDQVYIGNVNPKWFGGFTSTFSWKGLSLYARLDYALKFYQNDNILPWFMGMMQGTYNTLVDVNNTWTPTNTGAAYPKFYWADQLGKRNYARNSSMFMYESSYLAFREISLSYSLPKNWMKLAGITGAEFSVTGQNLGYLTKSKLYTPEPVSTGSVGGGYALPKTVILGVNLKF